MIGYRMNYYFKIFIDIEIALEHRIMVLRTPHWARTVGARRPSPQIVSAALSLNLLAEPPSLQPRRLNVVKRFAGVNEVV